MSLWMCARREWKEADRSGVGDFRRAIERLRRRERSAFRPATRSPIGQLVSILKVGHG